MNKLKKAMIIASCFAMLTSSLYGCTKQAEQSNQQSTTSAPTTTAAQTNQGEEGFKLPIVDQPIKVTWFTPNDASASIKSYNEMEGFIELQKRTGIVIEFQHPSAGINSVEVVNLAIASGELPDIINTTWKDLPGGIVNLINNNHIIKLNDLIDQFAPDYKKVLENPEFGSVLTLPDGTIPTFGSVDYDERRLAYSGFMLRKDWLDKLGLKTPATIDEWYTTLKAFKENDLNGNGEADELPYTEPNFYYLAKFAPAWGVYNEFHLDAKTGNVVYGPMEPGFREFLLTMTKWYSEGLIDPEFASNDQNRARAKLTGGTVGATFGLTGGTLGNSITAARPNNPDYSLIAVAPPRTDSVTTTSGKPYAIESHIVNKADMKAAIATSCKYPKEVVQMLNYLYTDEGSALLNWGIEGVSYKVENGKKVFMDLVMKNPDGLAPVEVSRKYALPVNGLTKPFDFDAFSQINLTLPEQKAAQDVWGSGDTSLMIPMPGKQVAPEQSAELAAIMNEIDTYKNETILKVIMGVEPIKAYDDFVAKLNGMKIDTALKIYQDAYDSYKQNLK